MRIISLLLLIAVSFVSSCSKPVFEAMEAHKFWDTQFILRKNGHYVYRQLIMGGIPSGGMRGRYIQSNDTVYFVKKKGSHTYSYYGYGIIDKTFQTFTFRLNDTMEMKTMNIR